MTFCFRSIGLITALVIGLAACSAATPAPAPIDTQTPIALSRPTATPTIELTPTSTATPAPSATPDPSEPFTIEHLRSRTYDSGPIEIVKTLESNDQFTRYLIAYPSDGLRITGMLDVPKGPINQHYPVIILNHGYIDPAHYATGSDTKANADYLARAGYLTLSPDYRGYAGSQGGTQESNPNVRGEDTFRVDFAIDVLNLLHAVPSLPQADPKRIGLWGHSMGGGITLKVLTIDRGALVKAAVLYGAMSGDEAANLQHIDQLWRPGLFDRVTAIYGTPQDRPAAYASISPLTYLNDIAVPISLHHGTADDQVPLVWSIDLDQRLQAAGKSVEFFEYNGAGHTFSGATWTTFMQRVTAFFDKHVKGTQPASSG
jgi:dipeptidyl aminopeptidase/acylaminoacyl peptidase